MNALIIGFGEVGRAHWENLKDTYPNSLYYKDIGPEIYNTKGEPVGDLVDPVDIMMISTQCDPADMSKFVEMVISYDLKFLPKHIDILTTTPPGTAEKIQKALGDRVMVTRSSIRGMHGGKYGIAPFLKDIPKHIGGLGADVLKEFYEKCGIKCYTHVKAKTVEMAHILNNFIYGVNIMAATEAYKYCRDYGIDYMEILKYRETQNEGFIKSGFPSKVSPVLTPAFGGIFGHCVVYSATTIDPELRGPLAKMLAGYNDKHKAPIKSDVN